MRQYNRYWKYKTYYTKKELISWVMVELVVTPIIYINHMDFVLYVVKDKIQTKIQLKQIPNKKRTQ